jgi:hypothetical protein
MCLLYAVITFCPISNHVFELSRRLADSYLGMLPWSLHLGTFIEEA